MSRLFKKLLLAYSLVILSGALIAGIAYKISPLHLIEGAVFFIFVLASIAYFLIIRPLSHLKTSIEKNFPHNTALGSQDEIGGLTRSLDAIVREFEEKNDNRQYQRDELSVILSGMVEGVLVIGGDEKILLSNAAVNLILDLRAQETIGRPYWEVIRNVEVNTLIAQTLKTSTAAKQEIAIFLPDERHFTAQVSPILQATNKLSGVVAVFHDITELKKTEKMRRDFVANVSHEFRTPLTSIKGFVETLQSGALQNIDTAKKFVDIIHTHTQRLESLVQDLLSLASVESGEAVNRFTKANVTKIINDAVLLYKEKCQKGKLLLTVEVPSDLPLIWVDEEKIGQVFSNLLDNAIKFIDAGGKITISASVQDEFVKIDVADTGIGISSEHLPRVFERFYRVEKSRSGNVSGTGLGLSIVKHIVNLHKGKITVQSRLAEGTTFSILLPKA